jgi:hypothetical protein
MATKCPYQKIDSLDAIATQVLEQFDAERNRLQADIASSRAMVQLDNFGIREANAVADSIVQTYVCPVSRADLGPWCRIV